MADIEEDSDKAQEQGQSPLLPRSQQKLHVIKEQRLLNHWECTHYSGNDLCTDGWMMLQVWHKVSLK